MDTVSAYDKRERAVTGYIIAATVYLLLVYFLVFLIPARFQGLLAKIDLAVSLALLLAVVIRLRRAFSVELLLAAVYGVWYIAVRCFSGGLDTVEAALSVFNIAVMGCCYFAVGSVLRSEDRPRLLLWAGYILGAVYLLFSVCGLYTALTGRGLIYMPRLDSMMVTTAGGNVVYFGINRNGTAPWFLAGLCLMIYVYFACGRKGARAAAAVTGALCFLIIALTHCRSISIAAAVCLAMLAMILVFQRVREKRLSVRLALMVGTAVAGVIIAYGCIVLSSSLISSASGAIARQNVQAEAAAAGESTARDAAPYVVGARDLSNLDSAKERLAIWRAMIPAIKAKPSIALMGGDVADNMRLINATLDLPRYYGHMHNMFLQIIITAGVPGLLVCLAFCVLVLIKMVRVFFSPSEQVTTAQRCVVLPMAGLFLYGLMEPMIFASDKIHTALFFVFAGVLIADLRDEKKRGQGGI